MQTAAERRAKIEKLRRDREAKEKERQERQAQQEAQAASATSSNNLIQQILSNTRDHTEQLIEGQAMASTDQVSQ